MSNDDTTPLKVVAIGLGKNSLEDQLPSLEASPFFDLIGVVDPLQHHLEEISNKYNVSGFRNVHQMLKKIKPDVAVISVPHNQYLPLIQKLAESKIHIIKEKPYATSLDEALKIQKAVNENDIFIGVLTQRRFNPIFQSFAQLKKRIGKIYLVEGKYTFNIRNLGEGWRASKHLAGGGALVDMGYHFIDLLVWYFGIPTNVTARLSRGNRVGQHYDVEDTVVLNFEYELDEYDTKTVGNIIISRVYGWKDEVLRVFGTEGSVIVERGLIKRLDANGEEKERLERQGGWPSAMVDQLEFFAQKIKKFDPDNKHKFDIHEHLKHIAIIAAAYRSDEKRCSINPNDVFEEFKESLSREA